MEIANTLCEQNTESFNVTVGGTCIYHWALRVSAITVLETS
jgi:hypothetical protein